ncbi:MAG: hypothetical protein F6K63_14765 [Moorea sp. SIO1G6]|uniref:hypothetical protein n=1 Tax=Moorena sp. SIO1G6 TaxID=2607840 RepID=UPI0013BECF6B|nr:hypothetical protein [Moorena sp. SIO1G6]NET65577.1 hypothetical protein [Moorena sp. SIO1G6]
MVLLEVPLAVSGQPSAVTSTVALELLQQKPTSQFKRDVPFAQRRAKPERNRFAIGRRPR